MIMMLRPAAERAWLGPGPAPTPTKAGLWRLRQDRRLEPDRLWIGGNLSQQLLGFFFFLPVKEMLAM